MSHTTETTDAAAARQIAAVEASSCAYRTGGESSPTATYQFDFATPTFFPNVARFLEATKHAGDQEVEGVGQSAVYSVDASTSKAAITVLLAGGKNFVLETINTAARKAALVHAAQAIAGRL